MKQSAVILLWTLFLPGCASLTKTQVGAVDQFAQTSENFSAYPSKIMEGLSVVRLRSGVYFAHGLSAANRLEDLDKSYELDVELSHVPEKVNITFQLIDKYAQALSILASDKFTTSMEEQSTNFGIGLDSLAKLYNVRVGSGEKKLPQGIGKAVGQLILLGGKRYMSARQAREIKKFVPEADTLIALITDNITTFLTAGTILELIENEEKGLKTRYQHYINQTAVYTVEDDFAYLQMRGTIDDIKALRTQTIQATRDLRLAHAKLLQEILTRKTLKETIQEMELLIEDVKTIRKTIASINSSN